MGGWSGYGRDGIYWNGTIKADRFDGVPTTSPAGSTGYVQFNDGGVFGGESTFTYSKTDKTLTVYASGGKPAIVAQGYGDGGYATYGNIHWTDGQGVMMGCLSTDSSSPSYGCFFLYGNKNDAGGRIAEYTAIDRAIAGADKRCLGFSVDYNLHETNLYDFAFFMAGVGYPLIISQNGYIGVGTSPVSTYSITTAGAINAGGDYYVAGTQGFTGTGAYTNFTIVGGIITSAT